MYKLSNKNRLHECTKPQWTEASLYISVSCTSASVCHQKPPPSRLTLLQGMSHETGGSEESGETWIMRRSFTAEATSSSETSREDTGGNVARMAQKIHVNKMLVEK